MAEEIELTTSSIKLQTLLHQFIQLYDRLVVEHDLMSTRELKIVKNLGNLTETIDGLNQTVVGLNELGTQMKNAVTEAVTKVVSSNWIGFSDKIAGKMDSDVNKVCRDLDRTANKLQSIAKEYDKLKNIFNLKLSIIVFLVGLSLGLGGSWLYLKKYVVFDWKSYKIHRQNK